MAFSSSFSVMFVVVVWMMAGSSSYAQLSTKFYSKSCPKVLSTVELVVKTAVSKEQRLGASLLRLFFHDCFVNGCDGSVLLDDTSSFTEEQTATPNNGSLRGFEVVDEIKAKVEKVCPGVVSCADILAIAARDSVVILGGPDWDVKLGRRDSKTASFSDANSGVLPLGSANLSQLISLFQAQGLSTRDMVALSGIIQGLTQLGRQGAWFSEIAYTTRQTSILHLQRQGAVAAQEPADQETTTLHP
ncbi:hypothetical protein E1A91_A03G037200v1 [Gossypium mustelinum]|uniref:peroxidase n=1 Tax=Gossypium mustelinum TaxID=34275 RepID=A0A5D2ZVS3_GOSMU|nr:hypothetical protein E1A91_A03G037200v1 [Gossypium mustelinum]